MVKRHAAGADSPDDSCASPGMIFDVQEHMTLTAAGRACNERCGIQKQTCDNRCWR
ncbi:MAG TPA: hypothetical protein VGI10_14525 [Polyangiaceae bacterium]|jgi:hypothetical protein